MCQCVKSVPVGCELTLVGESLAVDGAIICACADATVFCVVFCCACWELFCWDAVDDWDACWDACCCCACWTPRWCDIVVPPVLCNVGGLFCAALWPLVSSYITPLAAEWGLCPHQVPAVACDPAVTSWWGSYRAHASGMVEKWFWGEIINVIFADFYKKATENEIKILSVFYKKKFVFVFSISIIFFLFFEVTANGNKNMYLFRSNTRAQVFNVYVEYILYFIHI